VLFPRGAHLLFARRGHLPQRLVPRVSRHHRTPSLSSIFSMTPISRTNSPPGRRSCRARSLAPPAREPPATLRDERLHGRPGSTSDLRVRPRHRWRRESQRVHLPFGDNGSVSSHKMQKGSCSRGSFLSGGAEVAIEGTVPDLGHDIRDERVPPLSSRRHTTHSLRAGAGSGAFDLPGLDSEPSTSPADRCDRCTRSGHQRIAHEVAGRYKRWVDSANGFGRSVRRHDGVSSIPRARCAPPIHSSPGTRPVRAANGDRLCRSRLRRPAVRSARPSFSRGRVDLSGRTWSTRAEASVRP